MNNRSRNPSSHDEAPFSRLFVLANRDLTDDDIREAFDEFGNIKDVKAVKDRNTGENKGVFYVTYNKTSEAAKALECMKGKVMNNRSIKVMIATSREQGRGDTDEEHFKRLFIVVPKNAEEGDLYDQFKQYGNVEYVNVVKDKTTKQSKGFAYVKFSKFSEAAVALEQCDKKHKAVFAEPRKPKEELQRERNQHQSFSMPEPPFRNESNFHKLIVIAGPNVTQDQVWKLFDIVPSLDYCQIQYDHADHRGRNANAVYEVVYTDSDWAMYALEKFHGFEYPPGQRLIVKSNSQGSYRGVGAKRSRPNVSSGNTSELLHLAETIAQASSIIRKAGLSSELLQSKSGGLLPNPKNLDFCNKPLPPLKPLASPDSTTEARCFIICGPTALSHSVLKDIFCRFGNLIDVYMLNNKNCGYARYSKRESAERAIETLHGAEVLGIRLKVVEAEERPDKRQKMDNEDM